MTTIIDDPILRQGEQWKQEIAARQAQSAANIETVVAPAAVAEPDAAPEVTAFMRRASILIERGIPVAPLPPNRKMAPPSNWEKIATTDLTALAAMNPHADGNTAAVARAEFGGFCFFEVDRPNFHLTIQEQTGKKFPETLLISSSPGKGRGHFYWKHTAKSIALGNAQAKDERGELWSFRADRRYVVGPLSVKDDGTVYTIIKDHPIADCPDWLVEWIAANAENKKTGHAELDSEEPIAEGSRNNTLTSIAGRARQLLKMDKEELYQYLSSQNQKRCRPPLPESEVRTISTSVAGYAVKEVGQLVFPPSQQPAQAPNQPEEIAPVKLTKIPYPVFPEWVMKGTSLYEGFVRPVCAVNSRIPYFMFVPAAALMMNYLGNKVKVEQRNQIPSFFIVLIGEKGRAIKSSSVEDAIEYLQVAQIIEHAGNDTKNAGGKSLVWTVGSPEGLGLEMSRTNCGNAVLFYDELTTLTSKAEIDSSSLKSSLLTLYESGKFSNTIKSRKEDLSINPKR